MSYEIIIQKHTWEVNKRNNQNFTKQNHFKCGLKKNTD